MFLEASFSLAFNQPTQRVTVPAPSAAGRLLHAITFGHLGEEWERETFEPTSMVKRLNAALAGAGLTNVVSIAVDDELVYVDERRADFDLDPAMQTVIDRSRRETDYPIRLELVVEHVDDVGTYVIQITADRVHPVDHSPLRVRVFGLIGALDVQRLMSEGYRGRSGSVSNQLRAKMLETMRTADGYRALVLPIERRLSQLCETIEENLRTHLDTHGTRASLLGCAVRVREPLEFEQTRARDDVEVLPIFRGYPGLREATYYLRHWLPVLKSLQTELRETLIVDEAGRPILHIAKDTLKLAETDALTPGGSIAAPTSAFDVVYFAGNDYEQELRSEDRLSRTEAAEGDMAWDIIRTRQMGVEHRFKGRSLGAATGGGQSATYVRHPDAHVSSLGF